LLSTLAALVLTAAPTCGPLDLDAAISLAASRSDEVAVRQCEVAVAQAELALARALNVVPSASATLLAGPVPAAHGTVVASNNSNRSLADLGPFGRVDVQIQQPIYTFGRIEAAGDAARAGVRARSLLVEDELAKVQARIVELYWAVALSRRLLDIAAEVEKALADVDRRIAESLERADGSVTPADRYRVNLFHGLVRQREADARQANELARAGLAATLGLSPGQLMLKEDRLEPADEPVPGEEGVRSRASANRRDLRAIGEGIAAREAEVRAEEAAAKPQFFVGAIFGFAWAPNRDTQTNPWVHDDFNFLTVGLAVGAHQDFAFPLLFAKADKARAERAALERQQQALLRLVLSQSDGVLADLRAATERLAAARSTLASGRSWFRAAGLDFAAGLVEAKDLLDAYTGYVQSQAGFAQAAYDLIVARARLALVTGELPREGSAACELQ